MRGYLLSLVLLVGCGPSLPTYSQSEALAVLQQYAANGSRREFCTREGRDAFRGAAHAYARAMAEQGHQWPDLLNISPSNPNALETLVGAAVATQIVAPDDFTGPPKLMAQTINAQRVRVSNTARAWDVACPEMISLQRAIGRRMTAQAGVRAALPRRGEFADADAAERWHDAGDRIDSARDDLRRAVDNVESKLATVR